MRAIILMSSSGIYVFILATLFCYAECVHIDDNYINQYSNVTVNKDIYGHQHGQLVKRMVCTSSVKFIKCSPNTPLLRVRENKFKVSYTHSGCGFERISFAWSVIDANGKTVLNYQDYPGKATFLLTPYTLPTGKYHLYVAVTQKPRENKGSSTTSCPIEIRFEKPIAVIEGGSERYVRPDTDVLVDGEKSRNLDYRDSNEKLKYEWQCEFGTIASCDGTTIKDGKLMIPHTMLKNNMIIHINLHVSSIESNIGAHATQMLIAIDDAVDIDLTCLKNCPPTVRNVDHTKLMSLTVRCVGHCTNVDDNMYQWSLNTETANDVIDYDKDTQYGRIGPLFNVKPNVLQPATRYIAEIATTGNLIGFSSKNFTTRSITKIQSCTVQPQQGTALETEFSVTCVHPPGDFKFVIYSISQAGDEVVLASDSSLSSIRFMLPLGANVLVKMKDEFDSYDKFKIVVKVNPKIAPNADKVTLEKDVAAASKEIDDLLRNAESDQAVQRVNALAEELKVVKTPNVTELKRGFVQDAVSDIKQIKIFSLAAVSQIASTTRNILTISTKRTDPDIAEEASELCKYVAKSQMQLLNMSTFPTTLSDIISKNSRNLMACAESNLQPDPEILEPPAPYNDTTDFPIVVTPSFVENYPEYEDEDVSQRLNKLKKAGDNFMEICHLNAQSLAVSLVPGEKPLEGSAKTSTFLASKNYGADLSKRTFSSSNITVHPSKDFAKSTDIINTFLCTISSDPYWWNPEKLVVSTRDVAYLSFELNNTEVKKFKKPLNIVFKFKANLAVSIYKFSGSTPFEPTSKPLTEEYKKLEGGLTMYRIDVFAWHSCVVEFVDPTESFKVVTTAFDRPTENDFKNSVIVSRNNSRLFLEHALPYDFWIYVAILPERQTAGKRQFTIQVYTAACYHWNTSLIKWEAACKATPETNWSELHCACQKLSTLAGVVQNATVRLEETLMMDFAMEWDVNYVITFTCGVVVGLYCFLLIIQVVRARGDTPDCYFLSDVPAWCRYVYVLAVATGRRRFAGTTSNVTVRLRGARHASKVLTLAPHKAMLQRGRRDRYVLATAAHLGDITAIEVWYDHAGMRPSWYCKSIEVQDVQTGKVYNFEINRWFDLSDDVSTYIKIPVSTGSGASNGPKNKFLALFTRPNNWKIFSFEREEHITPFTKSNLMLSAVLMLLTVALLCYETPSLDINRGFARVGHYSIDYQVVLIGFGSALVSFLSHVGLLYLFRRSNVSKGNDNIDNSKKPQANETEKPCSNINFNTLAWWLLVTNIVFSFTILLIFGSGIAYITTLLWLTSVIIGILFYIIILENVIVLVCKPTVETLIQVYHVLSHIMVSIEIQRSYIYKKYGPRAFRRYFKHLYSKLDDVQIKEKRIKASARQQLLVHFEDLVMFIIYLVLLYLVVLADKNSLSYLSYQEVANLVSGELRDTQTLEEIDSINNFMEYLGDSLVPATQSPVWYGEYLISDPGLTSDMTNKYLGVVRLRQHRVDIDSCSVPQRMRFLAQNCLQEYSKAKTTRDFFTEWNVTQYSNYTTRLDSSWNYTRRSWLEADAVSGEFGSYPGGGYVLPLGRTLHNSLVNIKYIESYNWIDNGTRAVAVEFLLYCANSNLFNAVTLMVEFSRTGSIRSSFQTETVRLFFTTEEAGVIRLSIFTSFVVVVVIQLLRNSFMVFKSRQSYFKQFWRIIDIFIILLSVICLILFIVRWESVKSFLINLENSRNNELLGYFHLLDIDDILSGFGAFLVFVATLRLWKLMRFMSQFKLMEKSVLLALKPLLGLMLYFSVIWISCSVYAYSVFSSHVYQFKTMKASLMSILLMSIGMFGIESDDLEDVKYKMGYVFTIVFIFANMLFTTLFAAILMLHYAEAQVEMSNEREYSVKDYIGEEFCYYKTMLEIKFKKFRSKAGEDIERSLVYPKSDEHRYADSVTVSTGRMTAMYYIVMSKLRNSFKTKWSNFDGFLIKNILYYRREDEADQEDEMFFKAYDDGKMRIVSDERMKLMESIVEILVTPKKLEEKRKADKKGMKCLKRLEGMQEILEEQMRILEDIQIKDDKKF